MDGGFSWGQHKSQLDDKTKQMQMHGVVVLFSFCFTRYPSVFLFAMIPLFPFFFARLPDIPFPGPPPPLSLPCIHVIASYYHIIRRVYVSLSCVCFCFRLCTLDIILSLYMWPRAQGTDWCRSSLAFMVRTDRHGTVPLCLRHAISSRKRGGRSRRGSRHSRRCTRCCSPAGSS